MKAGLPWQQEPNRSLRLFRIGEADCAPKYFQNLFLSFVILSGFQAQCQEEFVNME